MPPSLGAAAADVDDGAGMLANVVGGQAAAELPAKRFPQLAAGQRRSLHQDFAQLLLCARVLLAVAVLDSAVISSSQNTFE